MLYIYANVPGVFICMLQVFHLYVCNGYKHVFKFFLVFCKCFRRMLQVFHLFIMYIVSVSSGCCKNRSGVAPVAMRVKSGGGESCPRTRFGSAGDVRKAWSPHGCVRRRHEQGHAGVRAGPECRRAGETEYSASVSYHFPSQ